MTCLGPIPKHLSVHPWYAPHQAYLRSAGHCHHDPAGASPQKADLRHADLLGLNLSHAILTGVDLWDADFSRSDLSHTLLSNTNLSYVRFSHALLFGVQGLPPVTPIPDLDAKILRKCRNDKLNMRCWHSRCGTAHCRAGWAIILAGSEGRALEETYDPGIAGTLIYQASCPSLPIPDFYNPDNTAALEDMRQRAKSVTHDLERS